MIKQKIFILIFLVLLSSCDINQKEIEQASGTIQEQKEQQNKKNIHTVIHSIPEKYLSDPHFQEMVIPFIEQEYLFVVQEKVAKEQNVKLCDDIGNTVYRDSCRSTFFLTTAIQKKDPAFCDNIENTTEQKTCHNIIISQTALEALDIRLCEKIQDTSEEKMERQDCKSRIFIQKAEQEENPKHCDFITDKGEQEMCRENIKMREFSKR